MNSKFKAERMVRLLKNLGYNARIVKRHFTEGSANYDAVYTKRNRRM